VPADAHRGDVELTGNRVVARERRSDGPRIEAPKLAGNHCASVGNGGNQWCTQAALHLHGSSASSHSRACAAGAEPAQPFVLHDQRDNLIDIGALREGTMRGTFASCTRLLVHGVSACGFLRGLGSS
jgi:hypothetical protein